MAVPKECARCFEAFVTDSSDNVCGDCADDLRDEANAEEASRLAEEARLLEYKPASHSHGIPF